MKAKLAFLVLYAILLTSVNCIKVVDNPDENNTTTVIPPSVVEIVNESNMTESENLDKEVRTIEDNSNDDEVTTPSVVHKIPPTLQNVMKVEPLLKEKKAEKSLKDYSHPTPAQIVNQNSLRDEKLKQAIIHSKQQSLKHIIDKSVKLKDQIARPAEVQQDIAVQTPPRSSSKEFYPSQELSPLYTPENNIQSHFHPMNTYYRPPTKQDAHFPQDNSFNFPQQIEAKWLGGNRSPNDNLNPNDANSPVMQQHGQFRNTHVDFQHQHADRQAHFHNVHNPHDYHHQHHFHHQFNHFDHGSANTGERMIFPNEQNPFSNDEAIKSTPSIQAWPTKVPDFNKPELKPKGSWKWIPEDDGGDEVNTFPPDVMFNTFPPDTKFNTFLKDQKFNPFPPDTKFNTFHSPTHFYDSNKPQTVRDRPYSFESSEIFSHHTTPPTGPGSSSFGATAEALTSEDTTTKEQEGDDKEAKLDIKHLRHPSPWKRFLHIMTAAIPIGMIISALTPRIVYIHPNATAPTLAPPFAQQPFQPPPPIPPSSPQQQLNSPFQQGPNAPFPLRQRAVIENHFISNGVNDSLAEFVKFMESTYREKNGKIDGTCEDRLFCEMALIGADPDAELTHRTLYKVAIETPTAQAEKSGLKEIFTAIKRHNCGVFKCKRT
ncbi:hypothetical protein ACKWTF_010665 [Chironomus riparius]